MNLKTIVLFFCILIAVPLFAQTDSLQTSTSMFQYNQYELQITFKNPYRTHKNEPQQDKNYFYQALEVVVFDEDQREFQPNAQRLMNPEPFILSPEMLDIDSLDIELDSEADLLIPKEEIKENYASLISTFGEKSSFYILPKSNKKSCINAAQEYLDQQDEYQLSKAITSTKWGPKKGLTWRAQLGKTRLDHYLVFGKKYNYLFVSSPYSGANGVIEKIILDMEIR